MHWMRKPRLNKAVATVAVETVLSLSRVVSRSLVIAFVPLSFRGDAPASNPERRVELVNRGLIDRLAKTGFQEIEITAFVGLLDVFGEHPAIAALEALLRLLPCGA